MSDTNTRAQKLASAIYLITGFFADQEPLKWRLRSLSADLVSESVKDKSIPAKEITALFIVAKAANLVSETNSEILLSELAKFETVKLEPLQISAPEELSAPERVATAPVAQPSQDVEIKDNSSVTQIQPKKLEEENQVKVETKKELLPDFSGELRTEVIRDMKPVFKEARLREFGAVSVKKNSRQSVIIGLLKRKKEIMIKDVSPLISGCGEKTIQRELSAMVAAGILRKMGEKRWSRYSLA